MEKMQEDGHAGAMGEGVRAVETGVRDMLLIARRSTHPGEMLREDFMPDFGLSVAELAKALGVSRQSVNELVRCRRAVSPDMALRLARLFGTSPQFWMNLQRNVDLWDSLEADLSGVSQVQPLAQLERRLNPGVAVL